LAHVEPVAGVIISHAGTTISQRLINGQRNSFDLIRGDHRRLEVEQWEWNGESFEARECLGFGKKSGAWRLHGWPPSGFHAGGASQRPTLAR